jgi:hypothetical protein
MRETLVLRPTLTTATQLPVDPARTPFTLNCGAGRCICAHCDPFSAMFAVYWHIAPALVLVVLGGGHSTGDSGAWQRSARLCTTPRSSQSLAHAQGRWLFGGRNTPCCIHSGRSRCTRGHCRRRGPCARGSRRPCAPSWGGTRAAPARVSAVMYQVLSK